jgi:hypothetical protein
MPSCIFLLSRFTLRVDNVLFRTFDTRIYHSFSSPLVIRELSGMEAPYEQVKRVRRHYYVVIAPCLISSIVRSFEAFAQEE